jgi:hypothetical protein
MAIIEVKCSNSSDERIWIQMIEVKCSSSSERPEIFGCGKTFIMSGLLGLPVHLKHSRCDRRIDHHLGCQTLRGCLQYHGSLYRNWLLWTMTLTCDRDTVSTSPEDWVYHNVDQGNVRAVLHRFKVIYVYIPIEPIKRLRDVCWLQLRSCFCYDSARPEMTSLWRKHVCSLKLSAGLKILWKELVWWRTKL